jgi:hypothetical protein
MRPSTKRAPESLAGQNAAENTAAASHISTRTIRRIRNRIIP